MDKATALANATDAVTILGIAATSYGINSPEAHSASSKVRDAFVIARNHGATDNDLRTTHTFTTPNP